MGVLVHVACGSSFLIISSTSNIQHSTIICIVVHTLTEVSPKIIWSMGKKLTITRNHMIMILFQCKQSSDAH